MTRLEILPKDDLCTIISKFNEYFDTIKDNKYQELVEHYKNNTGDFSIPCLYGLYNLTLNNPIQAVLWFNSGIDNDVPNSLYMLILYYKNIKHYKLMTKYCREYMKKYDHVKGSENLINYYFSIKKFIQAENLLIKNIKKYNDKGSLYTIINHYEMSREIASWKYYMIYMIKHFNDIEAIKILTDQYLDDDNMIEARFYAEYGIEKFPDDIKMINNITKYHIKIKDHKNVVKYCLIGIEKCNDLYSMSILACHYHHQKEYIEMKKYYLMLIKEHDDYEFLKILPKLTQYYILTNQDTVNVDEYLKELDNETDIKILKTKLRKYAVKDRECDICFEIKTNILLNCLEHYTCSDCNIRMNNICKTCFPNSISK